MRFWVPILLVAVLALPGCMNSLLGGGVGPEDYLSSRTYTKWVIEVDYASNHRPTDELLSFLTGHLQAVVDKPQGVEFHLDQALDDTSRSWTNADLESYASTHSSLSTQGATVVLHLLFVDGDHGTALGTTFNHGPIFIFSKSVDSLCNGALLPGTCSAAPFYHSVVLHEFGHAMGLVNYGIPMVHDHEATSCQGNDPKGHSANAKSVMTCTVDSSTNFLQVLGNNPPSEFDSDDRADLHAISGK